MKSEERKNKKTKKKNNSKSRIISFFGDPTGTRTQNGDLGGRCNILFYYEVICCVWTLCCGGSSRILLQLRCGGIVEWLCCSCVVAVLWCSCILVRWYSFVFCIVAS